jgi:hypothetical protein
MKKALLITLLNFFLLQNDAFATIQKIPENAVLKPHLSFKQKVFTYFLQKKIRYALAQQPHRIAPKDSSGHDCVQMKLKRGSTIAATIISMDDKIITYKLCDHLNIAEGTIRLELVAHIKDTNNRIIFNNEPNDDKSNRIGELTKGDKYATTSVTALGIALVAMVLAILAAFSALFVSLSGNSSGTEMLFFALVLTFVVGMLVSFIAGIAALAHMAKTPPQKSGSKFSATLSTILSGLVVLLMLIRFAGL